MMKSILPPLLRQCAMRRHHVIVTLMSCRRRSSNFPPWLVSVGAKAHDEKHSSAVAETTCDEETSRHSYSDVLPETKL